MDKKGLVGGLIVIAFSVFFFSWIIFGIISMSQGSNLTDEARHICWDQGKVLGDYEFDTLIFFPEEIDFECVENKLTEKFSRDGSE